MNNPPKAPELLLSKNLHGPATQLLRLVTSPPLAVQLQVLLQDQEEPTFHQDRGHDRHRPHLCSFGSISPTVQPLDFSVHVISHTGPYPRSSERRHDQKLFGQLSEIAVVVQNLIDFLQVPVLPLHGHIEFQTTTVTDCIRQTSVVSLWQPHNVRRARQSTHLEAHFPTETVDSSEVECGSQHFQFANVPHQPPKKKNS